MHRSISMMVLIIGAILATLAMSVAQDARAATATTRSNGSATEPSGTDAAEYERAPVTLDGEVLFQVRGILAYPAGDRAKAISKRIQTIAADESVTAGSLRVSEIEDRTRIMAGDGLVLAFFDADAAAEGISRQLLAEGALMKITAAIASYRNDRSPRVLLINTAYALGATVLLAIGLLVFGAYSASSTPRRAALQRPHRCFRSAVAPTRAGAAIEQRAVRHSQRALSVVPVGARLSLPPLCAFPVSVDAAAGAATAGDPFRVRYRPWAWD